MNIVYPEIVDELSEDAYLIAQDGDEPVKFLASNFSGGAGGAYFLNLNDYEMDGNHGYNESEEDGDALFDAILEGKTIYVVEYSKVMTVDFFYIDSERVGIAYRYVGGSGISTSCSYLNNYISEGKINGTIFEP